MENLTPFQFSLSGTNLKYKAKGRQRRDRQQKGVLKLFTPHTQMNFCSTGDSFVSDSGWKILTEDENAEAPYMFLLLPRFYFSLLHYKVYITVAHDLSKGRNSENISIKFKLNQRH